MSEFHAEASQATVSEGLAQSPYVVARAGFEPTTPGIDSANEPPMPNNVHFETSCKSKSCQLETIVDINSKHNQAELSRPHTPA